MGIARVLEWVLSSPMHRDPQPGGRPERLGKRRERGVGVHDHRVEGGVEPRHRALVVLVLADRPLHEDVAQAADDLRPVGAERGGRVQQRQQLELELPPAERVHLDEQHGRPGPGQRLDEQLGPPRAGLLDGERGVVADQLVVGVVAERRQVEHVHPAGTLVPPGNRPPLSSSTSNRSVRPSASRSERAR
jgi:hypothetical protein